MDILQRILSGEKLEDIAKPEQNMSIGTPAQVPQPTEEVVSEAPFSGGMKKIEQLTMEDPQQPIAPELTQAAPVQVQNDFDYLKELDVAQKAAAKQRRMAGLIEGFTQMATGATTAASGFGKPLEINLDFLRKEADLLPQNVKAKQQALLTDPRSPYSKQAQDALAKAFPNINSEMVSKLSASQIEKQFPSLLKMKEMNEQRAELEASRKEDRAASRDLQERIFGLNKEMKEQIQQQRVEERQQAAQLRSEKKAKPSEKQLTTIIDLDRAESDFKDLLSQIKSNKNWVGPVDGRIPDLLVGKDQVAFRSALGKLKDAYRKAVTGAGASNKEIEMLESRLPSENDSFDNFISKADSSLKGLLRQKDLFLDNLEKSGQNVENFKSAPVQEERPDVVERNGKMYKWNPRVNKYQLLVN
jgi:hypothetical protein